MLTIKQIIILHKRWTKAQIYIQKVSNYDHFRSNKGLQRYKYVY